MGHVNAFLKSGNPKTLAASVAYFDISFMVWTLLGALYDHTGTEAARAV